MVIHAHLVGERRLDVISKTGKPCRNQRGSARLELEAGKGAIFLLLPVCQFRLGRMPQLRKVSTFLIRFGALG